MNVSSMSFATSAYATSMILLSIMLSVSSIMLGVGYALEDKKITESGKYELQQALVNGAIMGIVIFGFGSTGIAAKALNGLAASYAPPMVCDAALQLNYAACFAYSYLIGFSPIAIGGVTLQPLLLTATGMLVAFEAIYVALSMIASLTINAVVVSIAFSIVLKPALSQLGYIINALAAAIVGIELQALLIKFASVVVPSILLPTGMALRMIYFTRKLGGSMIAISLGLFVILPFSYIMNAWQVANFMQSSSYQPQQVLQNATSLNADIINKAANATAATSSDVISLSKSVAGFASYFAAEFDKLANIVAAVVIEVFFLPAFGLIITAISIRELGRILGSEVSFGNLYLV